MGLRILQVSSADGLGGGERHVADLSRALLERGHEVHLAVRAESPLRAALGTLGVRWHRFGLRNALDVMSAWQLAELIKQQQIDVLHAHVARDYTCCGVAARIVKRHQPLRFLLTRHHYLPLNTSSIYAWTIAEADHLIAVSQTVSARLHEAFPQFAARIVTIPNWVDLRRTGVLSREIARNRLGITRPLAVGMIGQITRLKRQDLLLAVARELILERNWHQVDFRFIGAPGTSEDDAAYAAALRQQVQDEQLGEQVRFTGHLPEAATSLQAFDVVVVPSDNEAFSLVLVEAMSAGCAVVATRTGGMAEIVEDGVTGLFVTPDNLPELTNAVSRLLVDQHMRDNLGRTAQRLTRATYAREPIIDQIEALYRHNTE